jgi:hypothetical protein
VYVGESADITRRSTVQWAVRFGLPWGVVREMPSSTRKQRLVVEAAVAALFEARGFPLVALTQQENGRLRGRENALRGIGIRAVPPEQRRAMSQAAAVKMNLALRSSAALRAKRTRHWLASMTHEQRSEAAKRAWETKRRKGRLLRKVG